MKVITKWIFCLAVVIIAIFVFSESALSKVIVCFRYDYVSNTSDPVVDNMVMNVFMERNIPLTVAIIPFERDIKTHRPIPFEIKEKTALKKASDAGIVEIALHGFLDEAIAFNKSGVKLEYSFILASEQKKEILHGKQELESIFKKNVKIFVSSKEYDRNALAALEEAGIEILLANRNGVISRDSKLKFLPSTCTTIDLIKTVKEAKKYNFLNPIVINVFNRYEFMESDVVDYDIKKRSMSAFKLILNELKKQDDVEIMNIGGVAKQYPYTTESLMARNKLYTTLFLPQLFLPLPFFNPKAMIPSDKLYYLEADKAISIKKIAKLKVNFVNALSFLSFVLVGFLIFRFLILKVILRKLLKINIYRITSVSLFALAMLYSIRNGRLESIAGIIVAFFVGLLSGELVRFNCDTKKTDY
ncbi:MAG: DUF2334 domain-containing protein [Proteobacteria bacterium]|nr:DUF2334 domain-containing protein [Pseudomonadota bacterium]